MLYLMKKIDDFTDTLKLMKQLDDFTDTLYLRVFLYMSSSVIP